VSYTRYNRLNADGSGRFQRPELEKGRATRSQSALEYVLFGVFGLLLLLAAVALYTTYSPEHKIVPNYFAQGMKQDRLNLLFIGVGGDSHPGGGKDLADSIIFVSLRPSTKQAAVISMPRDLWVKIGRYGTHRLNSAHAIGAQSGYPGEGPGLLCDTVSGILDQPVHAYVRVDFSAFEKLVDDLGGVDVNVERSFYDYLFKDGFTKGPHHFNGKRALAYARYRYILGPEGDNFARELRQQQVMNALRDKLAHRGPADVVKLITAAQTLSDNTQTNLTTAQLVTLYRTFHDIRPASIRHVSLKPFTQLFEVTRINDPGEAVRPRTGDYREFQNLAKGVFSSDAQITTADQIQFENAEGRAPSPGLQPPSPAAAGEGMPNTSSSRRERVARSAG
jgi:LCP family protein required for cell wall assembly